MTRRSAPGLADRWCLRMVAGLLVSLVACSSDSHVRKTALVAFADAPSASKRPVKQPADGEVATAIQECLVDVADPVFGRLSDSERAQGTALYGADGFKLLWTDVSGRLSPQAHQSLSLLNEATAEGLDPADYQHDELARLAADLTAIAQPDLRRVAALDVAFSRAMLRYFRHLHLGRVDPRAIGFKLRVPAEAHDSIGLLRSALAADRIGETVAELRPELGQYEALRTLLTRYRSLAADAALQSPLPETASVRPGDAYAGIDTLSRRLAAFGDLPADAAPTASSDVYEGAIVEGVKRFQTRHGLQPDGVLGQGTQAALRVSVRWRVRQIELALERLRWLPDLRDERLLAINIPMFRLWAWDAPIPDTAPTLAMDVIVGRALNTQTPIFDEELREVIFRPYWNIPRSILIHEILPATRRDPEYLRRQDMEIVRGAGDDAAVVDATPANLALLQAGQLRLRQRPGAKNALGLVKFVFPNEQNVYLHDTPAPALFGRVRRDFSHGCVRVADPVALAEWALQERPEWSRDRIVSAMAGTQSVHVTLPRPVHVVLFYTTAVVDPENGSIHFADDIYRHDVKLDDALTR